MHCKKNSFIVLHILPCQGLFQSISNLVKDRERVKFMEFRIWLFWESNAYFGILMHCQYSSKIILALVRVLAVPVMTVWERRAVVHMLRRALLMKGHVSGRRAWAVAWQWAQSLQYSWIKLIGELATHLHNLARAAVVAESACHFLVGHGLAVALSLTPALGQFLFIFRDEMEDAATSVRPLDGVAHVVVVKGLVQIFI